VAAEHERTAWPDEQLKDRLIQIGFALVGVHITGTTALLIVAID
jgi:hypothetical protein